MNPRAQLIRRLAHDFVQRCRMALANTGGDANTLVDKLPADVSENVAADICATIGVDYEGPVEVPKRKDGRPAPWAAKHKQALK